MRADQLAAQGKEILYTNIGNPHQVGQKPISYYRQILALCDLPAEMGVGHPKVYQMFPKDVVERAKEYREIIGPAGTGAYTHSQGILGLRKQVAEYIQNRDGYPSYPGNIFLTNGASAGIAMVLQGLLASNNDAVMIPIPQVRISVSNQACYGSMMHVPIYLVNLHQNPLRASISFPSIRFILRSLVRYYSIYDWLANCDIQLFSGTIMYETHFSIFFSLV
jgi:glutamate--glyoxylate aminotransferase